ncbi:MAG TPA: tRNA (N6-threonylcarbamoyladenosine(37)-N6)-methyltransferase TrmO, partial [Reyranella sp.]|nr:tRNA (N6-threonylcarbamoyladenosine(37)-N6)-methyltransferase TrmO [Reyranella sp.]
MVRLNEVRSGELAIDLPTRADAEVYFIGRIRTPWTDR